MPSILRGYFAKMHRLTKLKTHHNMITKKLIINALNENRLSGKIETGQRYWVMDFKTAPYNKPHLQPVINFFKSLDSIEHNFSLSPIAKTSTELSEKINEIADKCYLLYQKINQ